MATIYDAIIIGTGQAGPSLAVRLAGTGMKVAIIERKRFGGTCVNTGCIPTKTLVASARAAHVARGADDYGVSTGGAVSVDMKKVKERKDAVVRRSNEGVEKWLKNTKGLAVYEGHARFAGTHQVRVGDDRTVVEFGPELLLLRRLCTILRSSGRGGFILGGGGSGRGFVLSRFLTLNRPRKNECDRDQ